MIDRVVFEKIGEIFERAEIIHCDKLDAAIVREARKRPSDAPEPINSNANSHTENKNYADNVKSIASYPRPLRGGDEWLKLKMVYNTHMKAANLITKEYENKWVALSPDHTEVIEFSSDLMDLKEKVGKREVVYMKVPASGMYFAFA